MLSCLRPDKSRYSERVDKSLAAAVTAVVVFRKPVCIDAKPWQTNTDLIDPIIYTLSLQG